MLTLLCTYPSFFVCFIFQSCTHRNDGANDRFMVLMRMKDRDAADAFFLHFNGRPFSSLEEVRREGRAEGGREEGDIKLAGSSWLDCV